MNINHPDLKVTDELFKEFFNLIPNPIYIWKKVENNIILIDYNIAAGNITNLQIKEYVGVGAKEFYKNRPDIIEDIYRCMDDKLNFSKEMSYKYNPGYVRHLYVTYNHIHPELILVHTEDITKQKKAEEYLRKSENEKTFILNGISELIVFQDKKNNIIWANKAAGESVATPQDELIGHKCYELWHNREIPCEICPVNRAVKTGKPEIDHVISPDGREWFIKGFPIRDENNTLIGITEVAEDISAQMKAEFKLKESEQKYRIAYNRTNLYKDIFTHDINNILQNILSSLELSKVFSYEPNKKHEFEEVTNLINDQVIRGKKLVKNVQNLSQAAEGKNEIYPTEALQVIKKTSEVLKESFHEKNINIEITSSLNEYYVRANILLKNIFENILYNAVYHNKNNVINIVVNVSKLSKNSANYIIFEVLDNGVGIPDSMKGNIFSREYKEGEIPTGIGLGLLLVKRILEMYNGEISVEDRIIGDHSQGSKFIILIPESEPNN